MKIILSVISLFIPTAHAFLREAFLSTAGPGVSGMFNTICSGGIFCVFGSSSGMTTVVNLARMVTRMVASVVGGLAVAVIVYAGIRMMAARGSDEGITEARKIAVWALVGLALAMLAPAIVDFAIGFISAAV